MVVHRRQTVSALLIDSQDRLLLQQRDYNPAIRYQGHWTTFGGAVEPGETADAAMQRELAEEISLPDGEHYPELRFWKTTCLAARRDDHLTIVDVHAFIGKMDVPIADITVHEGLGAGYFGLDDFEQLPIAFGFEWLFREFFAARLTFQGG